MSHEPPDLGFGQRRWRFWRSIVVCAVAALHLTGCLGINYASREVTRGYVVDPQSLAQIRPGTPAQEVLDVLGNPSTTSTVGGTAWYYVSQVVDQTFAFSAPQITDQRVVAIYFDSAKKVTRKADYGMKDGKVFDFVSRTTPTGGNDQNFIRNVVSSLKLFNHD